MRDPQYVQVILPDVVEPGAEYPLRGTAGWLWPVEVPLPQVGDRLRIQDGASAIAQETVEILARTWVCGMLLGHGREYGRDPRPGVILELRAQVVPRG